MELLLVTMTDWLTLLFPSSFSRTSVDSPSGSQDLGSFRSAGGIRGLAESTSSNLGTSSLATATFDPGLASAGHSVLVAEPVTVIANDDSDFEVETGECPV